MMGFWVVMFAAAAIWILFVMPVCGVILLAASLVLRRLHKRYLRNLPEGEKAKKWRKVVSNVCAVLAGLNLLGGIAGWLTTLILG